MDECEAVRRLVKSHPELWAQCSDATALARHLSGFGDITITRLEPERAVAWEGESMSGTVTLEASGWGTRVRITATPPSDASTLAAPPPANPPPANPLPVASHPVVSLPENPSDPATVPVTPLSVATASRELGSVSLAPQPPADLDPAPRGLISRLGLLRRRRPSRRVSPVAPAEEWTVLGPASAAGRAAARAAMSTEPVPALGFEEVPPLSPMAVSEDAPPSAPDPADDGVRQALEAALDSLGSAHHRPFSRG